MQFFQTLHVAETWKYEQDGAFSRGLNASYVIFIHEEGCPQWYVLLLELRLSMRRQNHRDYRWSIELLIQCNQTSHEWTIASRWFIRISIAIGREWTFPFTARTGIPILLHSNRPDSASSTQKEIYRDLQRVINKGRLRLRISSNEQNVIGNADG